MREKTQGIRFNGNMSINVKKQDTEKEIQIFDSIKNVVPEFQGIEFKHLKEEKTAIFDFEGYRDGNIVARADVKCRGIKSDSYNSFIVSKEKVWLANSDHDKKYYLILYFIDNWCRIYDLHGSDIKYEDFVFTHKRTKERMRQKVYKIPAKSFIYEYYLTP